MTKHFALMLMAVLALGGLAACDDKTTTETTEQSTDSTTGATSETTVKTESGEDASSREVNVETTQPDGTTVEKTTTTETEVDGDGSSATETKTETSVDPKGLMNKEETTHESTETKETE